MGTKIVARGLLFAFALFVASNAQSDTVVGSGSAAFQSWDVSDLNQSGTPFWDQTSMDGENHNIGFYLTDAPTPHLPEAPGVLPFWGNAYDSSTDSGGTADLDFFFQRNASSSAIKLEMEVAGASNINQFGWYDVATPSVLYPLFVGHDSAPATNAFSPSVQYGFYMKTVGGVTFYSQSSLNQATETTHQHFVVFQESPISNKEIYWLGVEDSATAALGQEGYIGDYNDMVLRLTAVSTPNEVPEPSTVVLVLCGLLVLRGLRRSRR